MKYNYSRYIGIPWESNGRDFNKALDCWGVVWHVYTNVYNIPLESLSNIHSEDSHETADSINTIFPEVHKNFDKITDMSLVEEGDIILMKIVGEPVHVGLAISNRKMIHSGRKFNCAVDDFNSREWKNRIEGVYRHKNFK